MSRNPPAKIVRFDQHRPPGPSPRTPGAMLVQRVVNAPPTRDVDTITRNLKLVIQACAMLTEEMRAGLWDDPGEPARRQR